MLFSRWLASKYRYSSLSTKPSSTGIESRSKFPLRSSGPIALRCPSLRRTLPAKLLSERLKMLHSEKLPRDSKTVSSKPDPWRSIRTTLPLPLSAANTKQRAYHLGLRGRTADQKSMWISDFMDDIIHRPSTCIHLKRNQNQNEVEAKLIHPPCCHTDIDDNCINHLKEEYGKMATRFGN